MKEQTAAYDFKKLFRKTAAVLLGVTLVFSSAGPGCAYAVSKPALPSNTARSAISVEADTGRIFYSKNLHYKRDPLSTTKLLTCLVALEHLKLNDTVTVTKGAVSAGAKADSSNVDLKTGEKVKVRDLLYACMLPSGNDAAVALAHGTAGTTGKFAELMNEKAKELGCRDSNFSNPQGWKESNHYTSVYDMAKITAAAMAVPAIERACSTEMYKMAKTNKHKARWIATTNYLVAKKKYPESGVYAGKTGTWDSGNAALVSVCNRNGKVFYIVVLKDSRDGRYVTTNKLVNYSYRKLKWMQETDGCLHSEKPGV